MEHEELVKRIEERKGERTYSNIITSLWAWGFENDCQDAVDVDDLQGVVNFVGKRFRDNAWDSPNVRIHVKGKVSDLSDKYIYAKSEVYKTDDRNGVCADGDPLSVRYVKLDANRVFKMKCGKFFRRLVDETQPTLPENVRVYFSEQLSAMFRLGHADSKRYTLTLDRDFEQIYSAHSEFGSCMNDKGQWKFYRDSSPDAQAAGLWENGKLVARCVVFLATDDDSGEQFRLAERQYGKNDEVKRHLVYLLAEQGKIDGHKQFGSSYSDIRRYVLLDGTDLSSRHLYVRCTAKPGDICSFQDGFIYLNFDDELARNWSGPNYDVNLSSTQRNIPGAEGQDGERGTEDNGHEGEIFVAADGEWYDEDNVYYLEYRNEFRHSDDIRYSEWEDRDLYYDDATTLYDNDCCHYENAVEIEVGDHENEFAYCEDEHLGFDYEGRRVLDEDCHEIFAGRNKGKWCVREDCVALSEDFYPEDSFMAYDSDEICDTCQGDTILKEDAVEICGETYHKDDDYVLAADTRNRCMVAAHEDDCVLISGTYYLMSVA